MKTEPKRAMSATRARSQRPTVAAAHEPPNLGRYLNPAPAPELLEGWTTEDQILDAARRCMIQFGAAKMSMVDVARVSGLSRGSVYKYFPDRESLVNAVFQLGFSAYIDDLDAAMSGYELLEDQLVTAAGVVRRWNHGVWAASAGGLIGEAEFAWLATWGSRPVMVKMIEVVGQRIEAARDRGELRPDIETALAAEWVARILHSISTNPAIGFDADDPEQLDHFIRSFLVRGFLDRGDSDS